METKNTILLRVLINRYHKAPTEALLRFLPTTDSQAVKRYEVATGDVMPALTLDYDLLKKMHHTWLIPFFDKAPSHLKGILLSMLPETQQAKIQKQLKLDDSSKIPLTPFMKQYYHQTLLRPQLPEKVLPLEYLPQTSLSKLADLNQPQLVELVQYLGLYDLAESIRNIINKNFLTKLYSCLTNKQRMRLRACMHKPEKIVSTRMDLAKWSGQQKDLDLMLQRRGLFRLGKALNGQHPDLMWYIAHTFDNGRGTILLQQFSPEVTSDVVTRLIQQTLKTYDFLHNQG